MDAAARGETALTNSDYEEAIKQYTVALKTSPTSPTYYIKRSTAYQRSGQYSTALTDANAGVLYATKRAKRELIAQGQLRRGIALYHLERFGDAMFCFDIAKRLDKAEKTVDIWKVKCSKEIRERGEDDEKCKVSVKEVPDESESVAAKPQKTEAPVTPSTSSSDTSAQPASATQMQSQPPAQGVQTPPGQIRHEWYQNNNNVYVSLMAKGIPKDQTTIDVQPSSLSISFPLPNGSTYDFTISPLFGLVDTKDWTSKILSTKLELTLKKAAPGVKWANLEGKEAPKPSQAPASASDTAVKQAVLDPPGGTTAKPYYPTSSRTGPKDWDKIVSGYAKGDTGDGKGNADAQAEDDDDKIDFDDEGGDDVNKFFKKLYAGASDETKRAMMKSYQESGGTALSTNWEEVSKAPVPVSPPDGMEARKWDQ